MLDMRSLKMAIDGSCLKNPGGPGGFAVCLEYPFDWDRPDELIEERGYFQTTNNRMELRACLFAHEWILEQGDEIGVQHVQIVTDSQYVHENYNRAIYWAQNDWRNSHERELGNVDLWKDLLRVRRRIKRVRVATVQIPRRSSDILIKVDNAAKAAARSPMHEDYGYQPGKVGRSRNRSPKAAKRYPATGEQLIIYVYRTQFVRRGVQTVRFQTYCEERRDFFDKYLAETSDAVGNSLHRGNVFLVRMNDKPERPWIEEILETLSKSDVIGEPVVSQLPIHE